MKWVKWLLASIGTYSVAKAIDLLSTPVDGSGIGLNLLGFEINDRLANEQIAGTAAAFAAVGVISVLMAVALHRSATKTR